MYGLDFMQAQILWEKLDTALMSRAAFSRIELGDLFDGLSASVLTDLVKQYMDNQSLDPSIECIGGFAGSLRGFGSINVLKGDDVGTKSIVIKFPIDMSSTQDWPKDFTPGQRYLAQHNIL